MSHFVVLDGEVYNKDRDPTWTKMAIRYEG